MEVICLKRGEEKLQRLHLGSGQSESQQGCINVLGVDQEECSPFAGRYLSQPGLATL